MSRISDLAGFTTALSTTEDLSVGIITASTFSGDGSGLTGIGATDNIQTATSAKFLSNVNVSGITTLTTLQVTGLTTVGVVTAATSVQSGVFYGPLTGNVTGNVTGDVTGDLTGNADTATSRYQCYQCYQCNKCGRTNRKSKYHCGNCLSCCR